MRKFVYILYIILLAGYTIPVRCQNLVRNSGFDSLASTCPGGSGVFYLSQLIIGWNDVGTPDWFNPCRMTAYSVPTNQYGFEYAHSDSSYVGIETYSKLFPNAREYVENRILYPLQEGSQYCVSFYMSLADSFAYACNNIGLFFTDTFVTNLTNLVNRIPEIEFDIPLEEKNGWMHITGSFTANGTEKYLLLGNFKDNDHCDTVNVGSICSTIPNWVISAAYYYIDDVTLTPINYFSANAGADTVICKAEQIQIGTPALSGCIYQWSPAEGLNDTTIAEPIATPNQTTVYILTLTDTNVTTECAVWHTTTDTVMVTVIPPADAGLDYKICEGDTVIIGTAFSTGTTYRWNPETYLSDYSSAQPIAFPPQTKTYTLTVSDSASLSHCRTTDTVIVEVEACSISETRLFPNPNYGTFTLEYNLNGATEATFEVFDVLGRKVFSATLKPDSHAEGRAEVHLSERAGVYFWRVKSGVKLNVTGKFVILN